LVGANSTESAIVVFLPLAVRGGIGICFSPEVSSLSQKCNLRPIFRVCT